MKITGSLEVTGSVALGKPDMFGNSNVTVFYNGALENVLLGAGNGGAFRLNSLQLNGQTGTSNLNAENAVNITSPDVGVTGLLTVTGSISNGKGTIALPGLVLASYADDTAAAAAGIPIGGLYRNGSFIQIRIV